MGASDFWKGQNEEKSVRQKVIKGRLNNISVSPKNTRLGLKGKDTADQGRLKKVDEIKNDLWVSKESD